MVLALATKLAKKMFGNGNERYLNSIQPLVAEINALEPTLAALDEAALKSQTVKLKARLAAGESLDDILPEAFATVREASKRCLGMRHFDVQLLGGIVLHQAKIAEMRTGEGKTLVATLAVYLNALAGKGVHVITVNDYLAKRDSDWMGQLYGHLGLSTGCIIHDLSKPERRAAYAADITYGTNNEFGFDYLRDNMEFQLAELVQRPFNFAIVDEVDSILIDEARTPLIISGPAEDSSEMYVAINKIIPQLAPEDIEKDEKQKSVVLTEAGQEKIEALLVAQGLLQPGGLYGAANVNIVHHVNQALRSHTMYSRDVDYIVKDDKLIIIDEFTGRMMEGRRFGDGLHQALEAKEGVSIQRESQTYASVTFQNFFRMYPKLSGMTGTALTEAQEFAEIYRLDVVDMPTNVDVARKDADDEIYGTMEEKFQAIITQIADCATRQQPVLVGTVSIERSEQLSEALKKKHVKHNVLNARHHDREAEIIAQAGRLGAVTIATNMAGRGTDIKLGGNAELRIASELKDLPQDDPLQPSGRRARETAIRGEVAAEVAQVKAAGGLYVIGTERHESRRIDNQLRGRSGRQGDPGASKFFLSLEDDLLRIFGTDRMKGLMQTLGLRNGEVIKHPLITRGLMRAQEKVEARNFDIRKNLLKFDNIMNDQRRAIYEQRRELMQASDVSGMITDMRESIIEDMVLAAIPQGSYAEQWDIDGLQAALSDTLGLDVPLAEWAKEDNVGAEEIIARIDELAAARIAQKEAALGVDGMRSAERAILLQTVDHEWQLHLFALDHVRQAIGLRAMAQRDPLNEYSREAFILFNAMMAEVRRQATMLTVKTELALPTPEEIAAREAERKRLADQLVLRHAASPTSGEDSLPADLPADMPPGMRDDRMRSAPQAAPAMARRPAFDQNDPGTWQYHVPRNAPCPCGSGKKYKQCHGAVK